jgi:hypothetical protein
MLTRPIVISACALCLAIPASAGASTATHPPKAKGPYGPTTTTDPQNIVKAKGPYGPTTTDPQNIVKAKGPYGPTTTTDPQNIVKAKGPYGIIIRDPHNTNRATTHAASASSHDGTNGWRNAAISEAALLAALALGSVLFISARRRAPRLET